MSIKKSDETRVFDLSRRKFIKAAGVGGVFVVGAQLLTANPGMAIMSGESGIDVKQQANLFVGLAADGTVEITCHRSDMGQQIRTAVAQIVADELEADWSRVKINQALGDKKYGDQNTDGSRSIRFNFERLRIAGSSVRHMLAQAAAQKWSVPASECKVINHKITHSSGKSLDFSDVVNLLGSIAVPTKEHIKLKERSEWRYINTGKLSVDIDELLTGKATFGADVRLANTKVAVIARPPVTLGKVKSFDASAAKAVPGVLAVVEMPIPTAPLMFKPLGGIAIVAENTWAAMQGRKALNIIWDDGANASYNSDEYRAMLEEQVRKPGKTIRKEGDVDKGLKESTTRIVAEYYVPHLAHAPMEPPVATARMTAGGVEVWSACQNPQADQGEVARILGLSPDKVKINVTLLGGAFGRKSKPDFSSEAAFLAKSTGHTIRLQWTREDEIQHGFYHTVTAQRLEGGLDKDGKVHAFKHRSAFPTISALFVPGMKTPGVGEMGMGLTDSPVYAPNFQMESGAVAAHVRVGWMRSVNNISHAFAVQSFVGELATAANKDPKDFLLEFIGPARHQDLAKLGKGYHNYDDSLDRYPYDTARLTHVVEEVANMAVWGQKLPKGRGLGIAAHRSFLSYVATVVEVEVDDNGNLTIPKVWMAIDAGTVVNTDTVKNQCQGGAIFGLSCALHAQITAKNGAVEQSNYHDYPVARMNEAPPEVEVHIVESNELPAGVGEPPTPPFAPALCNAIFAATGKRIRTLPIADQLHS